MLRLPSDPTTAGIVAVMAYRRLSPDAQKSVDQLLDEIAINDKMDANETCLAKHALQEAFFGVPVLGKKAFRIAAISRNTNSFGLYAFVVIARDGEAWRILGNALKAAEFQKGFELGVVLHSGSPNFSRLGFECPQPMPCTATTPTGTAPPEVVRQVWED